MVLRFLLLPMQSFLSPKQSIVGLLTRSIVLECELDLPQKLLYLFVIDETLTEFSFKSLVDGLKLFNLLFLMSVFFEEFHAIFEHPDWQFLVFDSSIERLLTLRFINVGN